MTDGAEPSGKDGEVGELLLPRDLRPDEVRPLADGRLAELSGETMGTNWSLSAVVPDHVSDDKLADVLQWAFVRVIRQMSQWDAESELSRFNRSMPGSSVAISADFAHVLDCALQVAEASDGAFDPTLGLASEMWGFGASDPPVVLPRNSAAGETRALDWSDVSLDHSGRSVLQPGGLALDLSGIAKGYGVDLGIHELEQLGVHHALLEIGGELRGIGVRPDGMPWWVDLDIPPAGQAPHSRIGLTGWAVATSGSYRRRRSAGGASWSHSLDPQTGMPLDDEIQAVTVLHKGCMQADALATAMLVMGPKRGIDFADSQGIPARVVLRGGTINSQAWRAWLN